MKIHEKILLSSCTTFRMGGIARKMYEPETVEELIELMNQEPELYSWMIGGGSNLLVSDTVEFEKVLSLRSFNRILEHRCDGVYYCGASVRLQKLIRTINEAGYGGIEYLFSVPGMVGGAVFMNAGRGKKHAQCISDYICSVDIYSNGSKQTLRKEDCNFSYRHSVFQEKRETVILGATFQFPAVPKAESEKRIQERIAFCKKTQDNSAPNFGTVFCEADMFVMEVVRRLDTGNRNGVHYSGKTRNWMLNDEGGTFIQAEKQLERVIRLHKMFHKKCRQEVRIWK